MPNKLPPELFLESEPAEEAERRFRDRGWQFQRALKDLGLKALDAAVAGSTISEPRSQRGGSEAQTPDDGPYAIDTLRRKAQYFEHRYYYSAR